MKELCNSICPRYENGVMFSDMSKGLQKRRNWCIHAIIALLRSECDTSKLEDAHETTMRYMARSSLMSTRMYQQTENGYWLTKKVNMHYLITSIQCTRMHGNKVHIMAI